MKRLRHDVNALVSIAPSVATTIAILTGIIADVWDLTGFVLHTYELLDVPHVAAVGTVRAQPVR